MCDHLVSLGHHRWGIQQVPEILDLLGHKSTRKAPAFRGAPVVSPLRRPSPQRAPTAQLQEGLQGAILIMLF
jgi:hypothetical protein